MQRPDYDASIVNLMASLRLALGAPEEGYKPLAGLPSGSLSSTHIILLVIDGLGHSYLATHPQSTLFRHTVGRLTSVFPTTTASAITTFFTGVAPHQHGVTGWYTWLRELGSLATFLPFVPRHRGRSYAESGFNPAELFDRPSIFDLIEATGHVVNPAYITDSPYSRAGSGSAHRHSCGNLESLFQTLRTIVEEAGERPSYTFAYWPDLDGIAHETGVASAATADHFWRIDQEFARFLDTVAGRDLTVFVTADHGLVDSTPDRVFMVDEHPALRDCLTIPLSGEPRAAFCYVRASRREQFESFVEERLTSNFDLIPGDRLIEEGYFGHGRPHPSLHHRVGDYLLLPKENWVIAERLGWEKPFSQRGVHGGLSEAELYVPLVVVRP